MIRARLYRIIGIAVMMALCIGMGPMQSVFGIERPDAADAGLDAGPQIYAEAAILYCENTGEVVYARESKVKHPPYDMVQLVTALVVVQTTPLDKEVKVSKKAASQDGTVVGLKKGEKLTVEQLLYGMLLTSGNDAAYALAESVSGKKTEKFVKKMNKMARNLGCEHTMFKDPAGREHEGTYTTAQDFLRILRVALSNETIGKITGTTQYTIPRTNKSGSRFLVSNVPMLDKEDSGIYAGKGGVSSEEAMPVTTQTEGAETATQTEGAEAATQTEGAEAATQTEGAEAANATEGADPAADATKSAGGAAQADSAAGQADQSGQTDQSGEGTGQAAAADTGTTETGAADTGTAADTDTDTESVVDEGAEATAALGYRDNGLDLFIVLLGDKELRMESDVRALTAYAQDKVLGMKVVAKGKPIGKVRVRHGAETSLTAYTERDGYAYLPEEGSAELVRHKVTMKEITAPVTAGDVVGYYDIRIGDKTVNRVPLISRKNIKVGWFPSYVGISNKMTIVICVVLAVLLVFLIWVLALRHRMKRRRARKRKREIMELARQKYLEEEDHRQRDWEF